MNKKMIFLFKYKEKRIMINLILIIIVMLLFKIEHLMKMITDYKKEINEKYIISSIINGYQLSLNNMRDIQHNYKIFRYNNEILIKFISYVEYGHYIGYKNNNLKTKTIEEYNEIIERDKATKQTEINLFKHSYARIVDILKNMHNNCQLYIETIEIIINTKDKNYKILKFSYTIRKPYYDVENKFMRLLKNINNPSYHISSIDKKFIFRNETDIIEIDYYQKYLDNKIVNSSQCELLNTQPVIIYQQIENNITHHNFYCDLVNI